MDYLDFYLQEIQEEEPIEEVSPLLAAFSAAGLLMSAYNIYKQYFTRAARACKDLPPREKGVCMWNWKLKGKQKEYMALKQGMAKCGQNEKCKMKIGAKLQKVAQQVQFITGRVKELRGQKYD